MILGTFETVSELAVALAQFGAVLYLVALVWFLFMAAVTFSLLLFVHES